MKNLDNQIIVSIKCLVYNHAPCIRQCLDGFVMQKTNFRFEAIIHDDASTDGTQDIIREYAEKYPEIIKPIYETENQYSKHDGSIRRITDEAVSPTAKYIASCEGDDYWTDPLKLQKQVGFLENHPDYMMVCNRTKLYSVRRKRIVGEDFCDTKDTTLKVKDVIYRTGLFISTCSIVYRNGLLDNYPDYCKQCLVGDYPLQIMAALKGKIYYFNSPMSVYRMENSNSWMGKQKWNAADEARLKIIKSRITMLSGFSKDYPQYKRLFRNKIADEIRRNVPFRLQHEKEYQRFVTFFKKEISMVGVLWKIDFFLRSTKLPLLNRYFFKSKSLFSNFYIKRLYY